MAFARSERLLQLLFLVDVEYDPAKMTGHTGPILDDAAPHADPMGDPRRLGQAVGKIEIVPTFDGSPYGLLCPLTVCRFKQGKKEIIAAGGIVGEAKKPPSGRRPSQLVGSQIEVPRSEPGSLDAEPKTFVTNEVVR